MQVNGERLIVARLGDLKRVVPFMDSYGITDAPTAEVLRKWRQRGIPGRAVLLLLALFEIESGAPVSVAPYLED